MSDVAFELLDETARVPLRERVGSLLADADTADFAVTRIRLDGIDLRRNEVGGVARCRVLLGRLDAASLLDAADPAGTDRSQHVAVLRDFADSGRLEVRAAGVAAWVPDFGLVRRADRTVLLLGALYFGRPYPTVGPSFTAVTTDPRAAALAAARFNAVWAAGHDVLPVIRDVLERAHELGMAAGAGGGAPDPARPLR